MPRASFWSRNPDAVTFASELRSRGEGWQSIADSIEGKYGERVYAENVRCYLKDRRLVNRKGADIPANLIEPREGFAPHERVNPGRPQHPKGWEPRVEVDGDFGNVVFGPTEKTDPDAATILEGSDLDPKKWKLVGNVKFTKWMVTAAVRDANGNFVEWTSKWNYYYSCPIARIDPTDAMADLAEFMKQIGRVKPRKVQPEEGENGIVAGIADLQMGKNDGYGTGGIVHGFLDRTEMFKDRVRDLRKAGMKLGTLFVFGLGDLIESCDGHYDQQLFRAQLTHRDQVKVARRLFVHALKEWAPLFSKVVVAAVGGNHGEIRKNGKSATDFSDNEDVAIVEMAEEVLAMNHDAFGHVTFKIPDHPLSLTLDACGVNTTIVHGHQMNGVDAMKKGENWVKGQAFSFEPAVDSRLLVSGHNHFPFFVSNGPRSHIQAASLEGASEWFRNQYGYDAPKGLTTFCVGDNLGPLVKDWRLGVSNYEVL